MSSGSLRALIASVSTVRTKCRPVLPGVSDCQDQKTFMQNSQPSNRNALDLIERDLISGAVIQLRGARALVCGHKLRVFQRAAVVEISGDAGRTKTVATDAGLQASRSSAALNHVPGIDAVHRSLRQQPRATERRAEEGRLAGVANPGGLGVFVEIGFEVVMRRHLVALAAFFVQSHPPALA